jgi:PAS domain S-box-containing protein
MDSIGRGKHPFCVNEEKTAGKFKTIKASPEAFRQGGGKMKIDIDTGEYEGLLRRRAESRMMQERNDFVPHDKKIIYDIQHCVHESDAYGIDPKIPNRAFLHTREELEDRLRRTTDLFERAPVGYIVVDRDGTIRLVNLTGVFLLGRNRSSLIGYRLKLLIAIEHRSIFDAFLERAFHSDKNETCEVKLSRENGESIIVELIGMKSDKEQEVRIMMADITQRKRADRERETMRLQFMQSQKMEAVSAVASVIAHDFNNILGGILGALSLIDFDLDKDSKRHSYVMQMQSLVERGADLTKQVLGFARAGRHKDKLLNPRSVVEKMTSMFGRTHPDIAVECNIATDLRTVLMDQSQFEQVMVNLFLNADHAMPDGGRLLVVVENEELSFEEAASHGAAPGWYVKLVVADTGNGMDAATKARIFEPFFTTKGKGQGTGLGLATVFNIIKSRLGFITVESEPGRGATFTLFLPSNDLPVEDDTVKKKSMKPGKKTILVVDDEEMIVTVNAEMLSKMGYDVLTASSGRQAVEILRQHKEEVSMVILDMIMPDMSGRETFFAMRDTVPDIKVLLSSGYGIDGQAGELMALGCNGFIQKPCNLADLSAKVKEILE